jgi:hypothetical protein
MFFYISRLTPPVSWAQRYDRIYLTIEVEDCVDEKFQLEENSVTFT